jgi:hypothetical protein
LEGRVRLKIFRSPRFFPGCEVYSGLKKLLAARIWNDYNAPIGLNHSKAMRFKLLVLCLLVPFLAGGALGAIVVEKRSHQMPYVEVFGCEGVHAFVFRGPKGVDRRPIMVPPREYWQPMEAGQYKFWLRDGSGNVCSRLVTPEVFARYQVGEDFNDCAPAAQRPTEDSKTVQPVVHHRKHTAQVRKRTRQIAKHQRVHRSPQIAAR